MAPVAPISNFDPNAMSFNPNAMNFANFDPNAISFDPNAVSFDPNAVSFDPKDAWHEFWQRILLIYGWHGCDVFMLITCWIMQVHELDPHRLKKEAAKVDKISRCFDFLVVLQLYVVFLFPVFPLRGHLRELRGLPSIRGPWRDLLTAGGDTWAEAGACGFGLDVLGAGASAYAGGTGATGWDGMDVTSGWGWVAEM